MTSLLWMVAAAALCRRSQAPQLLVVGIGDRVKNYSSHRESTNVTLGFVTATESDEVAMEHTEHNCHPAISATQHSSIGSACDGLICAASRGWQQHVAALGSLSDIAINSSGCKGGRGCCVQQTELQVCPHAHSSTTC